MGFERLFSYCGSESGVTDDLVADRFEVFSGSSKNWAFSFARLPHSGKWVCDTHRIQSRSVTDVHAKLVKFFGKFGRKFES